MKDPDKASWLGLVVAIIMVILFRLSRKAMKPLDRFMAKTIPKIVGIREGFHQKSRPRTGTAWITRRPGLRTSPVLRSGN